MTNYYLGDQLKVEPVNGKINGKINGNCTNCFRSTIFRYFSFPLNVRYNTCR